MNQCMQPIKPKPLKTLSYGDKTFKYRNILAKPAVVLLDEKHNCLFVVEHGNQRSPISAHDLLAARLSAYVISHAEKRRFRRHAIRLFVTVGDHTQIEIEPQLANTRQLIDHWQKHRRRDRVEFRWIPATVLAMVLTQHMYPSHSSNQGV